MQSNMLNHENVLLPYDKYNHFQVFLMIPLFCIDMDRWVVGSVIAALGVRKTHSETFKRWQMNGPSDVHRTEDI